MVQVGAARKVEKSQNIRGEEKFCFFFFWKLLYGHKMVNTKVGIATSTENFFSKKFFSSKKNCLEFPKNSCGVEYRDEELKIMFAVLLL